MKHNHWALPKTLFISELFLATAVMGGSALSAGASIFGSSSANDAQQSAAAQNNARLQQQYDTTRADLSPYRDLGSQGETQLSSQLPSLTAPINMNEATLQQTPGYQFNLTQGLKATQNSAAARGLGASGAAQKGAATFATGLADSTYQNQFNNANTNQTNAYNRLMGVVNTGEAAAAGTATATNPIVQAQVANTTGAANAQAASTNALGTALSGATNNVGGYFAYKGLYGGS